MNEGELMIGEGRRQLAVGRGIFSHRFTQIGADLGTGAGLGCKPEREEIERRDAETQRGKMARKLTVVGVVRMLMQCEFFGRFFRPSGALSAFGGVPSTKVLGYYLSSLRDFNAEMPGCRGEGRRGHGCHAIEVRPQAETRMDADLDGRKL
jgi:hypothetical protein